MRFFSLLVFLISLILTEITIIQPESLRNSISDSNKLIGNMAYSVSTFGHILYADTTNVQVLFDPDNEYGCEKAENPNLPSNQRFVFLFKRGICTFSAKASNSQHSGAYAALVYHDDPSADVNNIIPSGDSFYNNLKIPIILIGEIDGTKIKKVLEEKKEVMITIDLELVK